MKLQKTLEEEFVKRYKETDFSQNAGETKLSIDYEPTYTENSPVDYVKNYMSEYGIKNLSRRQMIELADSWNKYTGENTTDFLRTIGDYINQNGELKVEDNNNIEYNRDGIYIGDAEEYDSLKRAIRQFQASNPDYRGDTYIENGNNFYTFNSGEFDDFLIKSRMPIEGNEKIIDNIKGVLKNGTYGNTNSIDSIIANIYSRRNFNNRDNVSVEEGISTRTDDRLYNREQRQFDQANDNDGTLQTNGELDSSFSNDIAPIGEIKHSLAEVENYVSDRGYKFQPNGNLEVQNLTDKQIKDLVKLYHQTGYEDVSSEYLTERLKSGQMPIQREVADRFIEKVLGRTNWLDSTVQKILTNEVYKGDFVHGKRTKHPTYYENVVEPLVSKETWENCQYQKQRNARHYERTATYLFTNKLKCSNCGCFLGGKATKKKNGTRYFYYRCEKCKTYYTEEKIEDLLLGCFIELQRYDELLNDYYTPFIKSKLKSNIKDYEKELKELDKQLDRINTAYIKGVTKLDYFEKEVKNIEFRKEELNRKIEEQRQYDNLSFTLDDLIIFEDKQTIDLYSNPSNLLSHLSNWIVLSRKEKQKLLSHYIDYVELEKRRK